MNCPHKQVVRIEDSAIPDYRIPETTVDVARLVAVPQWQCIKCDTQLGYLSYDNEVVKIVPVNERT